MANVNSHGEDIFSNSVFIFDEDKINCCNFPLSEKKEFHNKYQLIKSILKSNKKQIGEIICVEEDINKYIIELCKITKTEIFGAISHNFNQNLQILCAVNFYCEYYPALQFTFEQISNSLKSINIKIVQNKKNRFMLLSDLVSKLTKDYKNKDIIDEVKLQIANQIINDFLFKIKSDLANFLDCMIILKDFMVNSDDKKLIHDLELCCKAIKRIFDLVNKLKNIKKYKTTFYLKNNVIFDIINSAETT